MQDHIEDTKVPTLIVTIVICTTLAYVVVGLRLISRRIGNMKLETNDWFIVVALVNALINLLAQLLTQ